ncbi:MAG: HD domain-containing phosphohydrolase [Spirochaetota bacterium]
MRSFSKLVRTELTVAIFGFGVAVVALAGWLVVHSTGGLSATQLRKALSASNSVVSTLHEIGAGAAEDPSSSAMIALTRQVQALRVLLEGIEIDERDRRFLDAPERFVRSEGYAAGVETVESIGRALNDRYFDRSVRHARLIRAFIAVLISLGVAFMALAIRTRHRYEGFVRSAQSLLDSVAGVVDHKQESIAHERIWEEERLLAESAERIARTIREDREMAGGWVYGNLEGFVPRLKDALERSMPCDRLAVAFMDGQGNVVAESAAVSVPEVHLEPGFSEKISETTLGTVETTKRPRIINDLEAHYQECHQSEGTELVLAEGIRSSITLPIVIRDKCLGFLFISSTQRDAYDRRHAARAEKLLSLLKQNIYFHYLTQQIIAGTANAFVNLMERKDNETSRHILRMSQYSHAIARTLSKRTDEMTPTMVREILWFAPLHDIGKIGIPDSILLKEGPLTAEERRTIEEHVPIGADVVKRMDAEFGRSLDLALLKTALDIIEGHHEHYDGRGYPRGLAGDAIPIAGRITAVADVFDALTSRRPYKEAMSIEEALKVMKQEIGTHFDPLVFDAFLASMDRIREIYDRLKEV